MSPIRAAWSLIATGAALALAACALPAQSQSQGAPGARTCNAAAAQRAVGQVSTPQLAEWALAQSGARTVRVIRHDDMVTKEYDTSRLNLQLDEGARVVRVYCG